MSAAQELTEEARRAVGGEGDTARGRGRGVGGSRCEHSAQLGPKAPDPKQPYSVFPLLLLFSLFFFLFFFLFEAAPRLSSKTCEWLHGVPVSTTVGYGLCPS